MPFGTLTHQTMVSVRWGKNVTNQLTEEQGNSRSLIWQNMEGHSCNIGNAPNLVRKKMKTAFCLFLVYFWYGFIFTKMGKARDELKLCSNTFVWQDLRFFCPGDILAISGKITCQSLNFNCQTLEKSLQFADQTYKLKKCIHFQVFDYIWFFWLKSELDIFSWIL